MARGYPRVTAVSPPAQARARRHGSGSRRAKGTVAPVLPGPARGSGPRWLSAHWARCCNEGFFLTLCLFVNIFCFYYETPSVK